MAKQRDPHATAPGPPLGAYSQGIRAGDFIFVSGCGPIDATTGTVRGETVEEQTHVVLDNITAILEAGGASLADVVKATVHLADETGVPVVQRGLRGAHARAATGPHHGRERPAPGARDARRGRRDRVCRGLRRHDGARRRGRHRLRCAGRGHRLPPRASMAGGSCCSTSFDLASQSSARAAGLSQQVQVDDVLAGLAVRGAEALLEFAALTGVALEVVVNGSVKVARPEHDAEQLREEVAPRPRRWAPRSSSSRPPRPARRGSLLDASDALAISYNPADLYIEHPATLPLAFIAALRDRGGLALAHSEVTDIIVSDDAIDGRRDDARAHRDAGGRRRRGRLDAHHRRARRAEDPASGRCATSCASPSRWTRSIRRTRPCA